MLIARHGDASHYVRPDRVIRTGVLESIVGYQPQQDVMDVAQAFTQGPMLFQQGSPTAGVAGPRVQLMGPIQFLGVSNLGVLQKLWLRFQTWRANKKAAAFQTAGMGGLFGLTPYGPAAWAGRQVMPEASARVGMLLAMQEKDQPTVFAQHNTDAIAARWNILRAPTR